MDVFNFIMTLERSLLQHINNRDLVKATEELDKLDSVVKQAFQLPIELAIQHHFNKMVVCMNTGRLQEATKCVEWLCMVSLPLDAIVHLEDCASELYLRMGNAKDAESAIAALEKLCTPSDHDMQMRILQKKMLLHSIKYGRSVDIDDAITHLGEAELIGDNESIAEAYIELGKQLTMNYPWLSVNFFRKAENFAKEADDSSLMLQAKTCRAKLYAMNYFQSDDLQEGDKKAYEEAKRIVTCIDFSQLARESDKAYYLDVRAFVLSCYEDYDKSLDFFVKAAAHHEVIRIAEQYLMLCLSKGDFDRANKALSIYEEAAVKMMQNEDIARQYHRFIAQKIKIKRDFFDINRSFGYPTLLEVLNEISRQEESDYFTKKGTMFEYLMPSFKMEGKFEAMVMPDGKSKLFPVAQQQYTFYRGQRKWRDESKASLYRNNMTDALRFVERLKYEEFKFLVSSHPAVTLFTENFYIKSPQGPIPMILDVDIPALAQHYGIKTELMDLTTDKFVAAFFACTQCKDEKYAPMFSSKDLGVFYTYKPIPFPGVKERYRPVGLQPFARPGEQRGYVLDMRADADLNKMAQVIIKFKHDEQSTKLIYNYANRQKRLFPEDVLDEKAKAIVDSLVFSETAKQMCIEEFYKDVPSETIDSYISETGVSFTASPLVSFSEQEINEYMVHAQEKVDEWKSKMITRLTYKGPIKKDSEED